MVLSYSGGYDNVNNFLTAFSAEDIKGIEVSNSDNFAGTYVREYAHGWASMDDVAFVEVTTRSGHGPSIENTAGMYLDKPLPISLPKAYYKPKYRIKDAVKDLPDLRSTIDWEPDIITDKNGEADIWFYTGGTASTYSIIVEGVDLRGGLGWSYKKMAVEK